MRKKKQPKPAESWRIIQVPIWDVQVFIYCGPWDSFIARLKEAGVSSDDITKPHDWTLATTYSRYDGTNIVYSTKPIEPSILVHELSHVAHGIMRAKDVSDEEAFAYTMEFLFKEATK